MKNNPFIPRLIVGGVLIYAGFMKAIGPSAEFVAIVAASRAVPKPPRHPRDPRRDRRGSRDHRRTGLALPQPGQDHVEAAGRFADFIV